GRGGDVRGRRGVEGAERQGRPVEQQQTRGTLPGLGGDGPGDGAGGVLTRGAHTATLGARSDSRARASDRLPDQRFAAGPRSPIGRGNGFKTRPVSVRVRPGAPFTYRRPRDCPGTAPGPRLRTDPRGSVGRIEGP